MKKVIKREPVIYIEFTKGNLIKYSTLMQDLDNMMNANWTDFNLRSKEDRIELEFLKERCINGEIESETEMSKNIIRLYWNSNEDILNKLIDELHDIAYS